MTSPVKQTFIPGPRLIDGTDLDTLVQQINTALASAGTATFSLAVTLSTLANAQLLLLGAPATPFRITAMSFTVNAAVTTGAKAATLTAAINGTNITTGGVLALTSANCTPAGAVVAATAPSAGNTGVAGATVGVNVSAVTTFVEGTGLLTMTLVNTAVQN